MTHITDNQDALLDYLYEEGDAAERLAIAKHLQECAACAVAVLEFQNVRGMLSDWKSPAADLGFRIVQDGERPGTIAEQRPRRGWARGWPTATPKAMPWLQAAAAVMVFAAGMAVSQLNIDYSDGRLVVSRAPISQGNVRQASITLPAENRVAPNGPPTLEEIDRLIADRLAAHPSGIDTEALLQRVRAMIDQSEVRQQRELALRVSQVSREVDTQHTADLLKIQQDFGKQQEALEYIVRTSGGVK